MGPVQRMLDGQIAKFRRGSIRILTSFLIVFLAASVYPAERLSDEEQILTRCAHLRSRIGKV
jgi:hypothetical protein